MKQQKWATDMYVFKGDLERGNLPYICRMEPYATSLILEWFDKGSNGSHTLCWRKKGSDLPFNTMPVIERTVKIEGLETGVDYELYIQRDDGTGRSQTRLVHPFDIKGKVINYIHPDDQSYAELSGYFLSSPNIIKLPSGSLIFTHDIFGIKGQGLVFIFRSDDNGKTWHHQTEFYPLSWAKMFLNKGELYIMGAYGEGGDGVIAKSTDEGRTWTEPVTIIRGNRSSEIVHITSTPVIHHNGRIYATTEMGSWGKWNCSAYASIMLSAPEDSDLLDPQSWDYTPLAYLNPNDTKIPNYIFTTVIEGNPIVGPDGEIYNLLRIDPLGFKRKEPANKAVLMKLIDFDKPLQFEQMVTMPVGVSNKFYVLRDEKTGLYYAIGNEETYKNVQRKGMPDPTKMTSGMYETEAMAKRRCIFTLSVSEDLRNWKKLKTLIDVTDWEKGGVSYPSFIIDGDDILYVSRTSGGSVKNEHDNNYVTFHRIENFRELK